MLVPAHSISQEVYEPLWNDLLDASESHGFEIRGIWAADTSNQGASGVLNESVQGDDRKSEAILLPIDRSSTLLTTPLFGSELF